MQVLEDKFACINVKFQSLFTCKLHIYTYFFSDLLPRRVGVRLFYFKIFLYSAGDFNNSIALLNCLS